MTMATTTSTSTSSTPKEETTEAQQADKAEAIKGSHDSPHQQQQQEYDPDRAVRLDQMETMMNLLVHPVWIFDYRGTRTIRWGNVAALELWNASSLKDLTTRSFAQMSDTTIKRNEEILAACQQGQRIRDQWTFYPKGQAKTVRVAVSAIRLLDDATDGTSDRLPHICFLVEGIPVEQRELDNEMLRGVEMLRHLPIAVCQFDMQGNCMFQNPEACLLQDEDEDEVDTDATEDTEGTASQPEDSDHGSRSDPASTERDQTTTTASTTTAKKTRRMRKRLSTSTTTTTTSTSDNTKDRHSIESKKRKKADGGLLSRFVDPTVGKQFLQQIQDEFPPGQQTPTCLEVEAMLHTPRGPTWSAIQVRQAIDPVTGQSVLLYNARDKTDAVQARKERQAREQKAEFLAIMAHEIRTPLHQVTGFVDLLDQTALDKEQKSFVGVLKSSAQGLMTVINDVLDYSKLEAGHMKLETIPYEPLSVTKGSLEAVRANCEERHLYLRLDWDTQIPFKLKNDPNRLRQILLNLLSNSVKFTKQGGITVKTSYLPHDNNDNNQQQPMIKFAVSDTGIGISQEQRDIIFQKYQQANTTIARNYGGTGLGLSICHSLVQMMGGSMGVDSQIGQGATFWFVLPAILPTEKDLAGEMDEEETMNTAPTAVTANNGTHSTTTTTTSSSSKPQPPSSNGLNVLVAEDNKINQKLVVNMLRRLGHTASVAENGKEAIDMIEGGQFDICLMDIQMPVCDGFEATKRLRSMGYTDLPIYGLTASVGRSDYVELGFNDWLPKPIRMKDLKVKLYHLKQQYDEQSATSSSSGREEAKQ